jgi:agmatinase
LLEKTDGEGMNIKKNMAATSIGTMGYSGPQTFFRQKHTRDLTGVDIAVTGIPLDITTTLRPGARFGPNAVRAASTRFAEGPAFPWGFDPFDHLSVADYGDCNFDTGFPNDIPDKITEHIAGILKQGAVPLSIGGDHFSSYPILRAIAEVHGPVGLVQFDAHPDTWSDAGEPLNHGTMFTRAIHQGLIDPERSIQIGIRSIADDKCGIEILTAPWVHEHGIAATVQKILSRIGQSPAYLTFDIDCLDPAYAPGTGTPVPGGLTSIQALEIVRKLPGQQFCGMDVVEISPPYDHSDITAILGATLAHEWIASRVSQSDASDN